MCTCALIPRPQATYFLSWVKTVADDYDGWKPGTLSSLRDSGGSYEGLEDNTKGAISLSGAR